MAKILLPPTKARRRELAFWIVIAIVLFLWSELERAEAANVIEGTFDTPTLRKASGQ